MSGRSAFNTPLQQLLLLEERIRRAGVTLPEDADQHDRFSGIKCEVSGLDCLVDIRKVVEVLEEKHVTAIPGAFAWIEGVMNYRGAMVPVFSPARYAKALGDETVNSVDGPLMVLRHGHEMSAIRITRIAGMQKFSLEEFKPVADGEKDSSPLAFCLDATVGADSNRRWRCDVNALLEAMSEPVPVGETQDGVAQADADVPVSAAEQNEKQEEEQKEEQEQVQEQK